MNYYLNKYKKYESNLFENNDTLKGGIIEFIILPKLYDIITNSLSDIVSDKTFEYTGIHLNSFDIEHIIENTITRYITNYTSDIISDNITNTQNYEKLNFIEKFIYEYKNDINIVIELLSFIQIEILFKCIKKLNNNNKNKIQIKISKNNKETNKQKIDLDETLNVIKNNNTNNEESINKKLELYNKIDEILKKKNENSKKMENLIIQLKQKCKI